MSRCFSFIPSFACSSTTSLYSVSPQFLHWSSWFEEQMCLSSQKAIWYRIKAYQCIPQLARSFPAQPGKQIQPICHILVEIRQRGTTLTPFELVEPSISTLKHEKLFYFSKVGTTVVYTCFQSCLATANASEPWMCICIYIHCKPCCFSASETKWIACGDMQIFLQTRD
jgi:hypothetical protein